MVVLLATDGGVWLQDTADGLAAPSTTTRETTDDPLDRAAERLAARLFHLDVDGTAQPVAYLREPGTDSNVGVFLIATSSPRRRPTCGEFRPIPETRLAEILDDPEAISDPYTLIAIQHRLLQIAGTIAKTRLDPRPTEKSKPGASGAPADRSAILLERADRYGYTATFDITWFQKDGTQGAGPTDMLLDEGLEWARSIADDVIVRTGPLDRYAAGRTPTEDPETGQPMPPLPPGFEVHPRPIEDG